MMRAGGTARKSPCLSSFRRAEDAGAWNAKVTADTGQIIAAKSRSRQ